MQIMPIGTSRMGINQISTLMKLKSFRIACSKPDWRIVLKFFREHRLLCTERIALMNDAARVCLTIHLLSAVQFSTFKIAMNNFRKYTHGYKLSLHNPTKFQDFRIISFLCRAEKLFMFRSNQK